MLGLYKMGTLWFEQHVNAVSLLHGSLAVDHWRAGLLHLLHGSGPPVRHPGS